VCWRHVDRGPVQRFGRLLYRSYDAMEAISSLSRSCLALGGSMILTAKCQSVLSLYPDNIQDMLTINELAVMWFGAIEFA
jgi:hypothetical protein